MVATVAQPLHVRIHQPLLPVDRQQRRHRHQPQRRLRRPLAQKPQRMLKTPKCIGELRINQQRIHRQPSQERVAARARSEGSGRISRHGSKCGPARSSGLVLPPFSHQNAFSRKVTSKSPPHAILAPGLRPPNLKPDRLLNLNYGRVQQDSAPPALRL